MDEGEETRPQAVLLPEALAAQAPVALQVFDPQGRCVWTNAAFRALFGSAPPEGYVLWRDEQLEARGVLPLARRALAGETVHTPPVWYDPRALAHVQVGAGQRVAVRATFFPLRGPGGEVGHLGIAFEDVTPEAEARLAAEEERDLLRSVARAEARLRFLAEASRQLFASLDAGDVLQRMCTLAARDLCDWCSVELLQPGGSFVRAAAASRRPGVAEGGRRFTLSAERPPAVREVLRAHAPVLLEDLGPEGRAALASSPEHLLGLERADVRGMVLAPLRTRGETLGVLVLGRMGEGPRFGAADVALAEELALRAAAALDNARLYAQAQDAVRARDEFLSVASHELKTPLTPLALRLDLVSAALAAPGPPDTARLTRDVEVVRRQVGRLSALVRELLDVSRVATGRLVLRRAPLDLGALARDVVEQFAPEAARAGCRVELDAAPGVRGAWDALRVEQVLSNLLSNAFKYGAGRPVHVRVARAGDAGLLEVRDAGIGVPPDAQARIFGKFERAVSERHYGGLGLGLFLARAFVQAHGGTLSVQSAPGAGARFCVRLPGAE